jgi:heptose I phosphotransferase
MSLKGECYRQQKGRLTQRVLIGGKYYYLKQHYGIGWLEIFKDLLQGRLPITSARPEWQASMHLRTIGIDTIKVVGFGCKGINPATLQSFVLMEEIDYLFSLEELANNWQQKSVSFNNKIALIAKIAKITRAMHLYGLNHRDLYLCHFLLSTNPNKLYLIDLHRMQKRRITPLRWIIKDLAALYFSSKDIPLNRGDYLRFIKIYENTSLKLAFSDKRKFWQKIINRGEKLYREHHAR